jgi:hypothetical protein
MNLANIPTAREMGTKLGSLSRLLFREKLIQSRSKNFIDEVSKRLKALKLAKSWGYTINESKSIDFVPIKDKKLGQIAPRVYIQKISRKVARIDLCCPTIVLSHVYRSNTKLPSWAAAIGAQCGVGNGMEYSELRNNRINF